MENHLSILGIALEHKNHGNCSVKCIYKEYVFKEIKMLDTLKAIHESDISAEMIEENGYFFAHAT